MKYIYSLIILVVSLSQSVVLASKSRPPIPVGKDRHTMESSAEKAEVRTSYFDDKRRMSQLIAFNQESMEALQEAVECTSNAEACEVLKAEGQRLVKLQESNQSQNVSAMSDILITNLNRALHSIITFEEDARANAISFIKNIAEHLEAGASNSKAVNMAIEALLNDLGNPNPTRLEIREKINEMWLMGILNGKSPHRAFTSNPVGDKKNPL